MTFLLLGCDRAPVAKEVVVYTSVDEPVATPILRDFEKQTGIRVVIKTDAEANKSVGLAERLRAEKDRPGADVWWNNEVFHTINLASEGVLASYESASAADVPAMFKDAQHRWASVGLRARVIAVTAGQPAPKGLSDLTDSRWKGKVAMATPTAGTTGGHVAALYVLWGEQKANEYFKSLKNNDIKLLGGNAVVADEVGNGTMWVGLTDNDDVANVRRNGGKIEMVLPDQDSVGTLTIPCTVAMVAGAPHAEEARKLVDYLLAASTEKRLIDAGFAGYSVRSGGANSIKSMAVDYAKVASEMPKAVRSATAILQGRQ